MPFSTIVSQTGRVGRRKPEHALVRTNPQRRLISRRKLRKQPYGYAGPPHSEHHRPIVSPIAGGEVMGMTKAKTFGMGRTCARR